MNVLARFKRGELRLNRIEAFSDGVFAIIVTLLVLELKVPELHHADSARELASQLIALFPKFLSWLISFVIVCKFWLNHHHVLGLARHADYAMVWINAIFLMFQSFIPFPTALMGEYAVNPLAVSLFGVVMAFNTILFMALHRYILRNLLKPELIGQEDPHIIRKAFIGVFSYLIGAAAAWGSVHAGFVMYMITPWFFIVPPAYTPKTTPSTPASSL
ncbi:TMEM175 family protein [Andreprevotia chitinilytica]|uniref:TMEM175 family protein n=1 Tax=Andreprevotia chitinilytica TaxID=396808 RepID=UPI00068D1238|nr:TMEM175 family protein [Andreprevotia chitinilytica]